MGARPLAEAGRIDYYPLGQTSPASIPNSPFVLCDSQESIDVVRSSNLVIGETTNMAMATSTAAARLDGQEKVIATAQQIVKSLATSKHAAEDMIRILSGFDNRLSTMIDLFPATVGGDEWPEPDRSGDTRLDAAEEVILRWESTDSFLGEAHAEEESSEYLEAVDELISLLESGTCPNELHSRAEIALQVSMAGLEEKFSHLMIRSTIPLNVDDLYSSIRHVPLSFPCYSSDVIEDDFVEGGRNSISDCHKIDLVLPEGFSHLKEIADRMLCSGYGKELCQIYSSVRRDILSEFLLILGIEQISIEEVQRIDWKALNEKMEKWIQAMGFMVRTLLMEEKRLCEKIFEASEEFAEECFAVVAKGCIMKILHFGDAISLCPRSAEKIFRTLDMYEALADVIPHLQSLFSGEAKDIVCREAEGILERLGDSIRSSFMEFTNSLLKVASRKPIQGGDIHPLTRYVMNYVKFLVNYSSSLDLLLDNEDLPEDGKSDDDQSSGKIAGFGPHLLLLISYLESILEQISKNYEVEGLQYIFLMNNVLYIVQKVKDSELLRVLGDHCVRKRRGKVKQFATSYLRASWTKTLSFLKDDGFGGNGGGGFNTTSTMVVKERFKNFNLGFEKIYRNQTTWKVSDPQLREELRISLSENVIPAYRSFLGRFGGRLQGERHVAKYIKYTPEELENNLSDFFEGLSELSTHPRRKLSSHHTLSSRG